MCDEQGQDRNKCTSVRKATLQLKLTTDCPKYLDHKIKVNNIRNDINSFEMRLRENLTEINFHKRMYEVQIHLSKVEGE